VFRAWQHETGRGATGAGLLFAAGKRNNRESGSILVATTTSNAERWGLEVCASYDV